MSGDQKKTIYDMGVSRKPDLDLRALTDALGAMPGLSTEMLEKMLLDATGVSGEAD